MFERAVQMEVGRRVHELIAAALLAGDTPDVLSAARTVFKLDPVGGSLASSARIRCSSAANVYLARCLPKGWHLAGVEMRVGRGVADLVWEDPSGGVLIDEVKSGFADSTSSQLRAQVARLARGGLTLWGDRFQGVRVVPCATPGRIWFATFEQGRLVTGPPPTDLAAQP